MKASHGVLPDFDDANLVSHASLVSDAGLVPVFELAERVGLTSLVEE